MNGGLNFSVGKLSRRLPFSEVPKPDYSWSYSP